MSICLYSQNKSVVKKSASIDTHTQVGEGKGGKGTRTASHNKQRGNEGQHNKGREQAEGAHNKQAEQRKEGGEGGGRKHTRTQPWHAKEQAPPSTTGNKAKPQQRRQLKQDSHREEQTHT